MSTEDDPLKEEDWRPIDAIAELSCASPLLPPLIRRPTFLHAAQHYVVCADGTKPSDLARGQQPRCPGSVDGVWNFHKGHVPPDILACAAPLLVVPPDDLFNVQRELVERRHAFMVCTLYYLVNQMAAAFKRKNCAAPNLRRCVRLTLGGRGDERFPRGHRYVCATTADYAGDI